MVTEIRFCVGIPAAGTPVDFTSTENSTNHTVISYSDADTMIPSMNWTIQKLSTINDDNLLDPNELFLVTVTINSSDNISIGPYDRFALEVKPPDGPVLPIERTVPGRISAYVNLH